MSSLEDTPARPSSSALIRGALKDLNAAKAQFGTVREAAGWGEIFPWLQEPAGLSKHPPSVDPGNLGVPSGAKVWLDVNVVGGIDNRASQAFLYEGGNPKTANYVITGTTLSNFMGLISVT